MQNTIDFLLGPIDEAIENIMSIVKKSIFVDEQANQSIIDIESDLASFLELELKEDLYCIIEYPYIDKVYRDSFYTYYSSKHYSYKRDCIRVSLFRQEINEQMFADADQHEILKQHYLGFFVIRPLRFAIFGRSHINPLAFRENNQSICSFDANSMILGVKFDSRGFPHISQDAETITCAETTIWGLMEYFGTKYPDYSPTLPSNIINTLKHVSSERQLPSIGLTMDQISYALKEFGLGTKIYAREKFVDEFDNILKCYIESGIPIVLGLEARPNDITESGHAVIALGKDSSEIQRPNREMVWRKFEYDKENNTQFLYYSDLVNKIIIHDDNVAPYRSVSIEEIGEYYEKDSLERQYKVTSIVVPLHRRTYLEAVLAKELTMNILKTELFGYRFEKAFIFRLFLASSRSLKEHISNLKEINATLKYRLLSIKMPKFVWCAEFYDKEGMEEKEVICLFLLDATEATHNKGIDALMFSGTPNACISVVDNKFVDLKQDFKGYLSFSNLN